MTKASRCTGHCCQNFYLPFSPDELDRSYRRWKSGGEQIHMNDGKSGPIFKDIHLITPMVVHLGFTDKEPRQIVKSGGPPVKAHRYRCKHFDAKAKVCTIYEIRPAMCRDYPGKAGCNFAACTWKSARRKKTKLTKGEILKGGEIVGKPKAKEPDEI